METLLQMGGFIGAIFAGMVVILRQVPDAEARNQKTLQPVAVSSTADTATADAVVSSIKTSTYLVDRIQAVEAKQIQQQNQILLMQKEREAMQKKIEQLETEVGTYKADNIRLNRIVAALRKKLSDEAGIKLTDAEIEQMAKDMIAEEATHETS